jgi:nitrite reductase (cytochrome c-552)
VYPEAEIQARVDAIQNPTHNLMQRTAAALTDMLDAVSAAKNRGATVQELAPLLELQRKAQWRLDFVAAENSMGFHAPAEAARILGESIDYARQAEVKARQRR